MDVRQGIDSVRRFLRIHGILFLGISALVTGIGLGWFGHFILVRHTIVESPPVRLGGYTFISPLLLCDSNFDRNFTSLDPLRTTLQEYIDQSIHSHAVEAVSVYFRYLNTGEEFDIDPDEKFYPASIKKLPMMIQYYKESESDPTILTTKRLFQGKIDKNEGVIYPPRFSPQMGVQYSADQLIEYMIKYSDNNSFNLLYPTLGTERADRIYDNMKLRFPNTFTATGDYITSYQTSLFFRILFSATYLNYENSEKALKLLSQTDFNNGLVKKLPKDVVVAHKFGVGAMKGVDGQEYGELHDCGIVYKKNNPYLLCVMTKSKSTDTAPVEDVIAEISAIIYQNTR